MTSYDTEEAPFAELLRNCCSFVSGDVKHLLQLIRDLVMTYRYTPMIARTHGQEAEIQSFGRRCLTWYTELTTALEAFEKTLPNLDYSRLSGAIGTHNGIDPELEQKTLGLLGFKPRMGATQIMPRILYSPIAGALADITLVVNKIANDIRLGARSGNPLMQEPFKKGQMGSSAMPHKKNTIKCENTEGMARMARKYAEGIRENICTWEERSIEQSCVERVFWPDLFHVTLFAIKNVTQVTSGLVVHPGNMAIEILRSAGTYASSEAKELLAELILPHGLVAEDAYRIVQLAAANVLNPTRPAQLLRDLPPTSVDEGVEGIYNMRRDGQVSLADMSSILSEMTMELRGKKYLTLDTSLKTKAISSKKFSVNNVR